MRYSRRRRFYGIIEPVIKSGRGFSLGACSPTLSRALGLPTRSRAKESQRELDALALVLAGDSEAIAAIAREISAEATAADSFEDAMAILFGRMWRCDTSERAAIVGAAAGARIGLAAMLAEPNTGGNLACIDDLAKRRIFELAGQEYYATA
jgi:hypothetical protein